MFWGATLLLALGFCLLTAPNVANAQARQQDTPEVQRDWTLRLGLYIFNSSTARSAAGEVGISGIAERTVYRSDKYDVNVGIGYNGMDRVYSVPITVTAILHQGRVRYGGGAGYAFGKRIDGRGTSGPVLSLLLGSELTAGRTPVSVDLRYNFISGSNNELDGYSLTIGARF